MFEIYITDRLKAINDSLVSFYGGTTTTRRYIDMVNDMKKPPAKEERTAEQVISSISEKLERIGKK